MKNTNNIFLRTYKPTTSTLRFKKKVHNIFFKIKKKFKCSFLKKSTQIRPFGRKLIRTKGRIIRNRVFNTDFKKNWNNGFYVIISHITVRRKLHSLIKYTNGAMTYTTTTSGCFIGDVNYTTNLPPYLWCFNKPGTTVLLFFLKKFSVFNNLVLKNKSKYAKANGTFCQIVEILEDLCLVKIKLPSGQKKIINSLKFATLGRCDNILWNREVLGKAGTMLNRGIKSKVRGVAMNPVDHPHGGRTKTNKPEVSPWGWVTKKNK